MLVSSEQALSAGMELKFASVMPSPNGDVVTNYSEHVEAIASSGFRGPVGILSDSVIKTAVFPDSIKGRLKDTIAALNWDTTDFPPAATEAYARHDAVVGAIISRIIPSATEGRIAVAESLGFVDLGLEIGYAQHLRRVKGKAATFLDDGSEVRRVAQDRQLAWDKSVEFGIEAGAQVHPWNPLGQNLWLSGDNEVTWSSVWFDYFARFPLKGRVLPNLVRYTFHKDAQRAFGVPMPFDKIHADRCEEALLRHRESFSDEQIDELQMLLAYYRDIRTDYERTPRARYIARNIAMLTGMSASSAVRSIPPTLRATTRLFTESDYRQEMVIDRLALGGYQEATNHGLVGQEEVEKAKHIIREDERIETLTKLGAFFVVSSVAWNLVSIPVGINAVASLDPKEMLSTGGILFFGPGVMRAVVVAATSLRKDMNLWGMAWRSAIPTYGTLIAIPSQVVKESNNLDPAIKHYALRGFLGKVSSAFMQGGMDSDLVTKSWTKGRKAKATLHAAARKVGPLAYAAARI